MSTSPAAGQSWNSRARPAPTQSCAPSPASPSATPQGGGKAENYLLRGFDADHGTDIAIFMDEMPVNLRSHANRQGYAIGTARPVP